MKHPLWVGFFSGIPDGRSHSSLRVLFKEPRNNPRLLRSAHCLAGKNGDRVGTRFVPARMLAVIANRTPLPRHEVEMSFKINLCGESESWLGRMRKSAPDVPPKAKTALRKSTGCSRTTTAHSVAVLMGVLDIARESGQTIWCQSWQGKRRFPLCRAERNALGLWPVHLLKAAEKTAGSAYPQA